MNVHSFIFVPYLRTRDENKEQAIRQKAIEMIVNDGFDGLSMQKLAKAAGVSPATIYIYFNDREDLILQVFHEVNNAMLESALEGFDPDMHFEEGMRIQWRNRARYYLKNPLHMVFLEQMKHSPFNDKTQNISAQRFGEKMRAFIQRALKRKELIKLPFEAYWSIAYAPLYQLVKYHAQGKSYGNASFALTDKVLDQTLSLVLKALKP